MKYKMILQRDNRYLFHKKIFVSQFGKKALEKNFKLIYCMKYSKLLDLVYIFRERFEGFDSAILL